MSVNHKNIIVRSEKQCKQTNKHMVLNHAFKHMVWFNMAVYESDKDLQGYEVSLSSLDFQRCMGCCKIHLFFSKTFDKNENRL